VITLFNNLGYAYNEEASAAMRRPTRRAQLESNRSHRVYGWFARSLMIFERYQPREGEGCSPLQ